MLHCLALRSLAQPCARAAEPSSHGSWGTYDLGWQGARDTSICIGGGAKLEPGSTEFVQGNWACLHLGHSRCKEAGWAATGVYTTSSG